MHHYTQGLPTRQAHKGIPEGQYEEEQGHLGFFGPVSHLIRKKPSTRWTQIEGELKPRLFDLVELKAQDQMTKLFYNQQLTVSYKWSKTFSGGTAIAERNADGDLLFFCHKGGGQFLTEYGSLDFSRGQYVVMPKCVAYFILAKQDSEFLVIENRNSHYQEPDRGIVGRHAIYDPNALVKPNLEMLYAELESQKLEVKEIRVKHNDAFTNFKYSETIFDVVGWKGDLYPYSLHTDHMMPLMSHRAHLPPSAHTTFVAKDFVICTFLPRPLEKDSDALKVPFYHQNMDYDEILFYHDGDFFSRDNLHSGMLSFHPAGFPHGPHPKAAKTVTTKTETQEYAVMLDSRWPLTRAPILESVEVKNYWQSWNK